MRARNLKPSIFTNELLAVADPLYTVIFEGLWCLADREGVLEDKPAKIHLAINPGRGFESTIKALNWLIENGFVQRYEVDAIKCLWVREFSKHQHPHKDEKTSNLPRPGASTMPAPCQHQSDTVPTRLLTDSLLLIPSSLIPDPLLPRTAPSVQHIPGHGSESESEIRIRIRGIKDRYPQATRPDWITGEKNARNLVLRGDATWDELYAGTCRYDDHCRATNRMVLNPARFFSDVDRPWSHEWAIPPPRINGKSQTPAPDQAALMADAKMRAAALGFRDPWPQESAAVYMTQVKLAESTPRKRGVDVSQLAEKMRIAK